MGIPMIVTSETGMTSMRSPILSIKDDRRELFDRTGRYAEWCFLVPGKTEEFNKQRKQYEDDLRRNKDA